MHALFGLDATLTEKYNELASLQSKDMIRVRERIDG